MREIKFRAWDSKNMITALEIREGDENAVIRLYPEGSNGLVSVLQHKFMQYTGLKDKNGVEIYEGDFITYGIHQMPFEVKYFRGAFWAQEPMNKTTELLNVAVAQPNCIIISNIFENPEWLEDLNDGVAL